MTFLAEKTNLAGPVQMESGGAERKRFGHAGSSVVEEQQQRTIPITMPRARIDCSDQRTCLLRLQVRHSSPRGPFGLYGKDGAVLPSAGDIVSEKILYEAPHRRQTAVTSDCGVATLRFDMFQKRQDRVCSNIVECQTCNRFVLMARKEQEEELQRIAVGSHGMGAGTACLAEIFLKEVLCGVQQRLRTIAPHRAPSPLS
jgi:hypothetical protein